MHLPYSHNYFIVKIHTFFISNARLKLGKNQAKSKQHPEAKFLLSQSYSLFSYMVSSKTNMRYSKKCAKTSVSVLIRL